MIWFGFLFEQERRGELRDEASREREKRIRREGSLDLNVNGEKEEDRWSSKRELDTYLSDVSEKSRRKSTRKAFQESRMRA